MKLCSSGSNNARRRLDDAMRLLQRNWRPQKHFYHTPSSFHTSTTISLPSSSSFCSNYHSTSSSSSSFKGRNGAKEGHYLVDTHQNSFINEFVMKSRESKYNLPSSFLLKFATRLRTNIDQVQLKDVIRILNQVRNPGYRFGKFKLRSSEGTTQLLQEVNNVIYKQFFHEEVYRRQRAYSHIFDIIHALRNVCATHPEIRNIIGTLTKVLNSIDNNGSGIDIEKSRIKLAFGGLMNKDGHFDHVRGLCNSLLRYLRNNPGLTFPFHEISTILLGLNQFDATHDDTRELMQLLTMRTEPRNDGIDYHPKIIRRALQGMANMKCDNQEVCNVLDLITIELEMLRKQFRIYDFEKIIYSLRSKRSESSSVRSLLRAVYDKRDLLQFGDILSFDQLGTIIYGFRNMSTDSEEVKQMILWIYQNLYKVIGQRREDEYISPIALGKMLYGVQRMSNVHDEENDLILDALMDCILCLKAEKQNLHEEIIDHHLISQIFLGLQHFKIKRKSHVQIFRYLLKVLQDKATKVNFRNRLSSYQALAVLLYGGKRLEETSLLMESLMNDHELREDIKEATQKLLENIFDDSLHHDYRDAKLLQTMQSRSEAKIFRIIKDEIHIHNRNMSKSRDIVVGFNEILFGFEADVVLYINDKSTDTVSRVVNIELDGSYHLEYHTKRFCDARDRVLQNKYGNEVIRLNLIKVSNFMPGAKALENYIRRMIQSIVS